MTTNTFMEQGGDGYDAFRGHPVVQRDAVLSQIVADTLRATEVITPPGPGRLVRL